MRAAMPKFRFFACLFALATMTLVHAARAADDVVATPQRVAPFQAAFEGGALFGGDGAGRFDVAPLVHLIVTRRVFLGPHFEYAFGFVIGPKGLFELTLPTRVDWTPFGTRRDGLVLRAGTRTTLAMVKTCSFGSACASLQDTPFGLGFGIVGELGLAVRAPMAGSPSQNFELSASWLVGPMVGIAGQQTPLTTRYQGFVVGMGVTSR
jgi:hypothetical protein